MRIANLRRALGGEWVGRSGGGYALAVPAEQVDALCFERLLGDGRALEALALWRGEPRAGIEGDWAEGERRRLCDLHLEAREKSLAARLEIGGGRELVGQLQTLVVDEPLRERPRELPMRALYRSGRQADALEAYRQTRSLFDRELGIEPSPQCASSNVRSSPTTATSLHRRKTGSGAGCLSPCLRSSWPPWPGHSRGRFAISEIDTTSARVTRTVRLDRTPAGIAANPKDVWVSVD